MKGIVGDIVADSWDEAAQDVNVGWFRGNGGYCHASSGGAVLCSLVSPNSE